MSNLLLQITLPTDSLAGTVQPEQIEKTISIMELITSGGTLYIVIPLLILSVIAVYIFVERILALSKASKTDPNFLNQVKDFIHDGKVQSAKALCENTDSVFSRMIYKGLVRIGKPLNDINAAVENVGKLEVYKLEKNLSTLATIAGAAPMIGFLGTVMGMIVTFHDIKAGGQAVKIDEMSGGIMQALVTTVAGLIIGIVAYIAYNWLVSSVEKVIGKMETITLEFMDILQEPAS